jgi:hypothetical protein
MRERDGLRALEKEIRMAREGKVKKKYVYGKERKEKWKKKRKRVIEKKKKKKKRERGMARKI